jgi:hypothetical protein
MIMDFTEEQIERYSRHIILPEIGGKGQARLLKSKVFVLGAGGLGSPSLLYLAAAGVGTIGIADYQCRRMLGSRYHRVAPAFAPGEAFPLDCVDRIAEMVAFAEKVDIAPAAKWLRRYWT